MSFEKNFCASPWFHMRIDNYGNFRPCRWRRGTQFDIGNIRDVEITEYFQKTMSPIRKELLGGSSPDVCSDCVHMEQHGKVSGRQRQLLKTGIDSQRFDSTFRTSTFFESFNHSHTHDGDTDLIPIDWQIDLGNYCNSGCIFCSPEWSSKLATEWKQIGFIDSLPGRAWTDDPSLVEKFCQALSSTPQLSYLHFIGGETLIIPGFKTILKYLIDHGHHRTAIGFTTNLTVWPTDVIDLLCQFENVHVGLSIECFTDLNDYLRWPSQIDSVKNTLDRWINLSRQKQWLIQIRPTPNCFSIFHLDTVYEFAWKNEVGVETCNFLEQPEFMRINALDPALLEQSKEKLENFLSRRRNLESKKIINTRNPTTLRDQVCQDAESYVNYIKGETHCERYGKSLVEFLKRIENKRNNRILDKLPEYEKFLRSHGY